MNERKNERMFLVKRANERTNESTNERRRERWWYNHRVVGSHSIRLVHFHQIHSIVSILEHSLATTFARWIETKEKSTYSNDSPGKLIPKVPPQQIHIVCYTLGKWNQKQHCSTALCAPRTHYTQTLRRLYVENVANAMGFLTLNGYSILISAQPYAICIEKLIWRDSPPDTVVYSVHTVS